MWLELLLLLLLVVIGKIHWKDLRNSAAMSNIPIVSKIPILGFLVVLMSFRPDNLHLKFEEFVARYGKSFYTNFFGQVVLVTADERHAEQLLISQKHLEKHTVYTFLQSWLGNGLLLSHGKTWQTMRKIITPTFHFKILEQFVKVFDRQSTILVEKLQKSADGRTVVDIYPLMCLATLDIISESAMGVKINAQHNCKSDFVQAVNNVTGILATQFMRPHLAIPWIRRILAPSAHKKLREDIAVMHNFTEHIIQERRKALALSAPANKSTDEDKSSEEEALGVKNRMALLDVLLQSTIDGQPLSDKQIRDEVNTFMFEGHDTTTSATSFCLYLISRHPECQQKLFKELRAHFGDDLERSIEYRDLQDLSYLNCIVKESLRIYPPISAIGRIMREDLELPDVTLPAGSSIIVLFWQMQRDATLFPEPEAFKPERFFEHANSFSYVPFSSGPRNCIGQRFALYEMKTIIVKILRSYELLPLGESVQPSLEIVLRSNTGVNFGIKPRAY